MTDTQQRMIIEGVMTTLSAQGELNIAPMGPLVDEGLTRFTLRPFKTSRTYQNIAATGYGVFHVTDDVLLIARGAMGTLGEHPLPATCDAAAIRGRVLTEACRYHELEALSIDDSSDRVVIEMRSVHQRALRDFWGFCRAKHMVLEAAILATRIHLTGVATVLTRFEHFQTIVDKTGGPREQQAMAELTNFVNAKAMNEP